MTQSRKAARLIPAAILLLLMVLSMGCERLGATATPDDLTFTLPTVLTVEAGDSLPGTDIRYLGESEQGARMSLGGESAIKRRGDSVVWEGRQARGVAVDLNQRIVWYTERQMHLVGTAHVALEGVRPRAGRISTDSPIQYTGPVAYSVERGQTIPGSTLRYLGAADEGAEIGNIEGYRYRRGGDSILWDGSLRDGVYSRLELRVVHHDEQTLRVAGVVTLWITP